MKQEMTEKFMGKLLEYIEKTDSFITSEAPDYISQLLHYSMFENQIWLGFIAACWVAIILLLGLCVFMYSKPKIFDESAVFVSVVTAIFVVATIISSLIVIPMALSEMYMIENAPKVFIVQELR